MSFKRLVGIAWPLAAVLVFGGTAVASPASTNPNTSNSESREAAKLLREIRLDARQVRARAWQWDLLAKRQTSAWYRFDRQWNSIKPAVEDMNMKLARLERMQPRLTSWERQAVEASKPLVAGINSETHNLRTTLDKFYADLSLVPSPAFRTDSRILARDSGRLARVVERSKAG